MSQESQVTIVNQAITPAIPDTVDLDLLVPFHGVEDSTGAWDYLHYGMPIANPCCVDAKMKYWWPEEKYHYNMPNAFPENAKSFRFKYQ
ncbi:MAG: hypothetical protein R3222_03495 [Balneolaceae bacterium]|nr:hypothetical protein [Balneolaceae bacterium]